MGKRCAMCRRGHQTGPFIWPRQQVAWVPIVLICAGAAVLPAQLGASAAKVGAGAPFEAIATLSNKIPIRGEVDDTSCNVEEVERANTQQVRPRTESHHLCRDGANWALRAHGCVVGMPNATCSYLECSCPRVVGVVCLDAAS